MNENTFVNILTSKINNFVQTFKIDSKSIFYDKNGNLIHPGEFGIYREKIVKDMLRSIIPHRLDIGTGFIITSSGKISTQCDLIIYDRNNCPLIENTEEQRFFPIECVVAVGEIKSDLTKTKLKEALLKLKNIKLLRNDIPNNDFIHRQKISLDVYSPDINPRDQIITFLVCNIFDFEYEKLVNEMDKIYDNCDNYLRHNMILSINDGTLLYKDENKRPLFYPSIGKKNLKNSIIKPPISNETSDNKDIIINEYEHIIAFLNYLYMGVSTATIIYPEMTTYLGNNRAATYIDETIE